MKTSASLVFATSFVTTESVRILTKLNPKAVTSRSPVLVIVWALLLMIDPFTQAAIVTLVSPQAYENMEGEQGLDPTCCGQVRFQQIFPAADFAALGGVPHWITSITVRPDQSLVSARTVNAPDQQLRLSTTTQSPENLSLRFDDNFGSDVTEVFRGRLTLSTDASTLTSIPRGFYRASYEKPFLPFLYDPSQGNLLMDVIAWGGISPSTLEDYPNLITAIASSNPTAEFGQRTEAGIYQFTFVSAPEPSTALLGLTVMSLAAAVHRRRSSLALIDRIHSTEKHRAID
jgi:hypothetical protein